MLDVRVHPDKKRLFFSYSEPSGGGATTALGTATLENGALKNFRKIFAAHQPNSNRIHFGSRVEFDGQGHLFLSIGDRNERQRAQKLDNHQGKIIRLREDGSIPEDNPFRSREGARAEIWSYGHRNPQGLAWREETGELWSAEMGPRGGDELNLIKPGSNYGWPEVTKGREYWGPRIGKEKLEGMVDPVVNWTPSISPSGLTFYTGEAFPKWKGNAFLACLSGSQLRRVVFDGAKVVQQEALLEKVGARFRQVRTGPDGFLYLSTDDGRIVRLVPEGKGG
jgi:aldose sugar dehydrogenase